LNAFTGELDYMVGQFVVSPETVPADLTRLSCHRWVAATTTPKPLGFKTATKTYRPIGIPKNPALTWQAIQARLGRLVAGRVPVDLLKWCAVSNDVHMCRFLRAWTHGTITLATLRDTRWLTTSSNLHWGTTLQVAATHNSIDMCRLLRHWSQDDTARGGAPGVEGEGEGVTLVDVRAHHCLALSLALANEAGRVCDYFWSWRDPASVAGDGNPASDPTEDRLTPDDVRVDDNFFLRCVVELGSVPMLQFLMGCGLTMQDVRAANNEVLKIAVSNGRVGVLQFLREQPQGLTVQDLRAEDNYAVRVAAHTGNMDMLRMLKAWQDPDGARLGVEDVCTAKFGALASAVTTFLDKKSRHNMAVCQFLCQWVQECLRE